MPDGKSGREVERLDCYRKIVAVGKMTMINSNDCGNLGAKTLGGIAAVP